MFRKWVLPGLLYIMTLALCSGCSLHETSPESAPVTVPKTETAVSDSIRLSIAASSEIPSPDSIVCSDGTTLEILKYPDGVLGSDLDMLQGCQAGTVSIFAGGVTVETDLIPELSLLTIPYLLNNMELSDYRKALQEEWVDWFQPYYNDRGLELLGWDACYMGILLSKEPIKTIEDLQGLSLRTMRNSCQGAYWSALGADVKMLSFDELGYYLETEQIDAMEVGLPALARSGYLEQFHYVLQPHHIPAMEAMVMNKKAYDALTPAQQQALKEYVTNALKGRDVLSHFSENYNLKLLTPDSELLKQLMAERNVVIQQLRKELGKKTVDTFLAQVEAFRP